MTNDLISREALLIEMAAGCMPLNEKGISGVTGDESTIADYIKNAPAVDAAPVVHGRWIHCAGKSNLWHCSECGGRIMYNQTRKTYNIKKQPVSEANKFCKHCGAKIDGERDKGD